MSQTLNHDMIQILHPDVSAIFQANKICDTVCIIPKLLYLNEREPKDILKRTVVIAQVKSRSILVQTRLKLTQEIFKHLPQ